MEYQHKLLLMAALLVAVALYVMSTAAVQPPVQPDTKAAEALLMRSIGFGEGQTEYSYTYSEVSDGYQNIYLLARKGNESSAEVQNPLSSKKAYFLQNDTILCMRYPITMNETCASVAGNQGLQHYLEFLGSKFFSNDLIFKNRNDMAYLIAQGYVTLEPAVDESSSDGRPCSRIGYRLDMTNITLTEAARFGIGSNAPKVFDWTMCIDNSTGVPYEKSFSYVLNSTKHTYGYKTLAFSTTAMNITPPAELGGDVESILYREMEQQIKLASCITTVQGAERDRCVSMIALDLRRTDICELAGERKDRCLISIVPLTMDQAICTAITDSAFKDDCYIELAGAYKNSSYCANIQDSAKTTACMNASRISEPAQDNQTAGMNNETAAGSGNATGNGETGNNNESEVDINKLLNYIDKNDGKPGNETNATGSNGSG